MEALQTLIWTGILPLTHLFYLLIRDGVRRIQNVTNFKWHPVVMAFWITIFFHSNTATMNLLRGPVHQGGEKYPTKAKETETFVLSKSNLPFVPSVARLRRHKPPAIHQSGFIFELLLSFLYVCISSDDIVPLLDCATVTVYPVALAKDATAIKQGLQVDPHTLDVIGHDDLVVDERANLEWLRNIAPRELRRLLASKAEVIALTTLDNKFALAVAQYFTRQSLGDSGPAAQVEYEKLVTAILTAQICAACLRRLRWSPLVVKNILSGKAHLQCKTTECKECHRNQQVCPTCKALGHKHHEVQLRSCDTCIGREKCQRLMVPVIPEDCEAIQKRCMKIMVQKRRDKTAVPGVRMTIPKPESVHVGKTITGSFKNWMLLIFMARICLSSLGALRLDPKLKAVLCLLIAVDSIRRKDQQATESICEITDEAVMKYIEQKRVKFVIQTGMPSLSRFWQSNPRGILRNASAVCLGPRGHVIVVDGSRILMARMHNPMDVSLITASMVAPSYVTYSFGWLFVCDGGQLFSIDIDFKGTHPATMTVDKLKSWLEEKKLPTTGLKKIWVIRHQTFCASEREGIEYVEPTLLPQFQTKVELQAAVSQFAETKGKSRGELETLLCVHLNINKSAVEDVFAKHHTVIKRLFQAVPLKIDGQYCASAVVVDTACVSGIRIYAAGPVGIYCFSTSTRNPAQTWHNQLLCITSP